MGDSLDLSQEGLDYLDELKSRRQSGDLSDGYSVLDKMLKKPRTYNRALDYAILSTLDRNPTTSDMILGELRKVVSLDKRLIPEAAKRIEHLQRQHLIVPIVQGVKGPGGPFGNFQFQGSTRSGSYSMGLCEKCCSESVWNPGKNRYSCNCGDLALTFNSEADYYNNLVEKAREEKLTKERAEQEESIRNRPGLSGGSL